MLSKDDYKNYLDEMMDLELTMSKLYKGYADSTEDSEVKGVFLKISGEEVEHYNMVRSIAVLLMRGD